MGREIPEEKGFFFLIVLQVPSTVPGTHYVFNYVLNEWVSFYINVFIWGQVQLNVL